MKIRGINDLVKTPEGSPHTERKEAAHPASSFQSRLKSMSASQYEEYIGQLADRISEQGARLGKKADMVEFQRYRDMVSEFMHEVSTNAYSFDKENGFDARGRRRIFATINKINGRLDEMARDLLVDQVDNIKLLNDIDDIRGMIVDIML